MVFVSIEDFARALGAKARYFRTLSLVLSKSRSCTDNPSRIMRARIIEGTLYVVIRPYENSVEGKLKGCQVPYCIVQVNISRFFLFEFLIFNNRLIRNILFSN